MTARTLDNLQELVKPDRVHRDIYEDPAIFEIEMERIFGRMWVYIGHESQVSKPGDFFCTWIGTQPVVMTRHSDGKVYVLHNRCGHRGVKVVNEARGNSKQLRCMFHGWTYDLNGELSGLTQPEGYTSFDVDPVAFGMHQVAKTESVHGFLFACASEDGPSFGDYFGGVTSAIEDLVAYAPDGEVEVTGGVLRYGYPGNWKLQADNVCDMYHVVYAHESSSRGGAQYVRRQGDASGIPFFDNEGGALTFDASGLWGFPNGHGWEGALPQFDNEDALWHEYVELLEARNGKARAKEILTRKRHNTIFYPNVVIQDLNMHVRVIRPIRVDLTEVTIYPIKLKGAPEQMFRDAIRLLNTTNSAASLTQADDVEAFTRGHAGLRNRDGNPWVLFARGDAANEVPDETYEDGHRTFGSSEMLLRLQYQSWLRHMTAA